MHLLEALHLVQAAGRQADAVLRWFGDGRALRQTLDDDRRHGVITVVDGEPQHVGQIHVALRAGAAAGGPLLAAAGRLHAADERAVPGVLQGEAAAHESGDDHVVVFKGRHAAGDFCCFNRRFPERGRRVFMDAERLRGIVQDEAARRLEHHIGDGVRGVVAVLVDAAHRHELAGGVAGVGLRRAVAPGLVHLGDLQIEQIQELLAHTRV